MKIIDIGTRSRFNSRCPYTNAPCDDWNCLDCEVEKAEEEWMKALDEEEEEVDNTSWQARRRQ